MNVLRVQPGYLKWEPQIFIPDLTRNSWDWNHSLVIPSGGLLTWICDTPLVGLNFEKPRLSTCDMLKADEGR